MDDFKRQHDEYKCKQGCCHAQPNKVARVRTKHALRRLIQETERLELYEDEFDACKTPSRE